MNFSFRDKYTDNDGVDVERVYNTRFFSYAGGGAYATRTNPTRSTGTIAIAAAGGANIFAGGVHKFSMGTSGSPQNGSSGLQRIIGHGMGDSIIDALIYQGHFMSGGNFEGVWFKDVTIKNLTTYKVGYSGQGTYYNRYYSCEILASPTTTNAGVNISNYFSRCVFRVIPSGTINNNNAFINISTTIGSIAGSLHTFEKCNLIVSQASLDSHKNNYYAFDNCNFRIGTETDYTPLTGTTAEELRSNFVARCTVAGLTVPNVTDYGMILPAGRWLFTKNQIFEGITWAGSEINQFEIPRFISLGYSASRGTKIPITTDKNVPASFAPGNPNSGGLNITADSLSISPNIDITQRTDLYIDSKIIWLGGKKKLTKIDVPNNMPYLYGVLIDSLPNLGNEVNNIIEAGEMYIVRSSDENVASVTYNGSTYSSALSSRNNIFKGVAGATSFVIASGRAVVYKINDILNYQSIQLRIVNQIPNLTANINQLANNYWYLVEHGYDQSNTTDYVTVGGVKYYVGDSFLVTAPTENNSVTGNVHLRRCWAQDFNFDTEVLDKDFWQNEQKPEWCDVLPEDPRCLMKNNSEKSAEMMRGEDGKYITTGHPEYYNRITGASGVQSPSDIFIQGTYMQIRLQIIIANPM